MSEGWITIKGEKIEIKNGELFLQKRRIRDLTEIKGLGT